VNDVTLFGNCVTISEGSTPTFMRLLNPPDRPIEIEININTLMAIPFGK